MPKLEAKLQGKGNRWIGLGVYKSKQDSRKREIETRFQAGTTTKAQKVETSPCLVLSSDKCYQQTFCLIWTVGKHLYPHIHTAGQQISIDGKQKQNREPKMWGQITDSTTEASFLNICFSCLIKCKKENKIVPKLYIKTGYCTC